MPRLPDVQSLGARPSAGPQRQIVGFDTPSIAEAEAQVPDLSPVAAVLSDQSARMFRRQDAIAGAHERNGFNQEVEAELLRASTEGDLSHEDTLTKFGAFVSTRMKARIAGFQGGADARAALAADLEDSASRYAGQAGALSTRAGLVAIERSVSESANPLIAAAWREPGRLDDLLLQGDRIVARAAPALAPGAENAMRAGLRDAIAGASVDAMLMRGDIDGAEFAVATLAAEALTPGSASAYRQKIASVRSSQNAFERELAAEEMRLGRSFSEAELLRKFGAAPPSGGGLTVFDPATGNPLATTGPIPPGGMTTATRTSEERQALQAGARLTRLDGVGQAFDAELLTLPAQANVAISKLKERFGVDIGDEERAQIEAATTLSRRALEDLNLTLRDMSGAAITPQEADRLRAAMPDPENDSPTEFVTKYNDIVRTLRISQDRHLANLGLPAQSGPAEAGLGEGTIATNPATGESVRLRNGVWEPI